MWFVRNTHNGIKMKAQNQNQTNRRETKQKIEHCNWDSLQLNESIEWINTNLNKSTESPLFRHIVIFHIVFPIQEEETRKEIVGKLIRHKWTIAVRVLHEHMNCPNENWWDRIFVQIRIHIKRICHTYPKTNAHADCLHELKNEIDFMYLFVSLDRNHAFYFQFQFGLSKYDFSYSIIFNLFSIKIAFDVLIWRKCVCIVKDAFGKI